jgi:filamentous hemagglutinin
VDPDGRDPGSLATGETEEVTRCHVNPHNDARENAIGGAIIGGELTNLGVGGALVTRGVARAAGKLADKADNFFEGSRYTDKVLGQMKQGDFHAFPESVKGFQDAGQVTKITGGDGVARNMLKIPGSYRGKDGYFEFIKEPNGAINHRLFRPNPGQ